MTVFAPPPPPLNQYSPIPVLHELGCLYVEIHKIIREFEKLERYTLGTSIEKALLDCIHECYRVTAFTVQGHKLGSAVSASAHFDTVKMYIRIATQTRSISEDQYTHLLPRLATIGPMLGGWVREISKNTSGRPRLDYYVLLWPANMTKYRRRLDCSRVSESSQQLKVGTKNIQEIVCFLLFSISLATRSSF